MRLKTSNHSQFKPVYLIIRVNFINLVQNTNRSVENVICFEKPFKCAMPSRAPNNPIIE